MKKLLLLFLTLCLTGCSVIKPTSPPAPVPDAVTPAVSSSAADHERLYLYTDYKNRYLAIDAQGSVVMEVTDGQLDILEDEQGTIGLCVVHSEGFVTDEYGWTVPEETWCNLYNTDGTFLFRADMNYAALYNGILSGYNNNRGCVMVYRWSDGKLLYDNAVHCFAVGDYTYVNQNSGDDPGFILDQNGRMVYALPENCVAQYTIGDKYLIITQNDKYGIIEPDGTQVLPCQYEMIRGDSQNVAYVQTGQEWQVLDLATGEILFRWPYEITYMLSDSALVSANSDYGNYLLVDRNGEPLIDQTFSWPDTYDFDKDGTVDLIRASINEYSQTILFRPDGTLLYTSPVDHQATVLDENTLLLTKYTNSNNTFYIFDLSTGSQHELFQTSDGYVSPLYGINGMEPGLLNLSAANAQGWYRTDILDYEGNVILQGLQDCNYRGNGIFQCSRGFSTGLMRLDGTWLYEESSFSQLNDN